MANENKESPPKYTLQTILGEKNEDIFLEFDLTEIKEILDSLSDAAPDDIALAEELQLKCLRGADIITDYLARLVKTVTTLEAKLNRKRNEIALSYVDANGKASIELKKMASESSSEVEDISISLGKAKGSKVVLEKKFDILIRSHHFYKDIAAGLRRTILGHIVPSSNNHSSEKVPEGYE